MTFSCRLSIVDFLTNIMSRKCFLTTIFSQELEKKRKESSQVTYDRKKQLNKLRVKAENAAEEKLGSHLDILAPVKY